MRNWGDELETRVVEINSNNPEEDLIKEAADFIIKGELVGFPRKQYMD